MKFVDSELKDHQDLVRDGLDPTHPIDDNIYLVSIFTNKLWLACLWWPIMSCSISSESMRDSQGEADGGCECELRWYFLKTS